jgi:hypothetical protein
MPARYEIDKERRLVISTGWGRLSFGDAQAHQEQLLNDPDFDPEFNQLIDWTAVTAVDIPAQEVGIFAGRTVFSRRSRRAFVAPGPANFGIARAFKTYHEMSHAPSQVGVFRDLASALQWLGVNPPPA